MIVILSDTLQIVARGICLADGTRREIHNLISVLVDVGVQFGNTKVCPITPDQREHVPKRVRPVVVLADNRKRNNETHFVIVPSMSDTTTLSECSHKKTRAAHATTPDEASENVIVFAPGRRSSACYDVT